MVLPKEFFEKVDFEKKNQQTTKKHAKLPSRQRVKQNENERPRFCLLPDSMFLIYFFKGWGCLVLGFIQ